MTRPASTTPAARRANGLRTRASAFGTSVRTALPITQDVVAALFNYDQATGNLTHRARTEDQFPCSGKVSGATRSKQWNNMYAGKVAGRLWTTGYIKVVIGYKTVLAHRAIWLLIHGYMPECVDHINGDRADNRLCNLRSANTRINGRNAKRRSDNKSGFTGVCWSKMTKKWEASIAGVDGVLGYFTNIEDAVAARKDAETRLGYHPNHGRS